MIDIPPYPYKDPLALTSIGAVLDEIEAILEYLEAQTHLLNCTRLEAKPYLEWYDTQLAFLKRYYERIEGLVHHGC